MNRGNQILVGILVVQLVLGVVVFWPRQAAVAAGEPLLAGVEVDQIARVTLRDAAGEQVQLTAKGRGLGAGRRGRLSGHRGRRA